MAKSDKHKAPALSVIMRGLESLIPYARNARTHSDEQVAQIAGSIKEFGFNDPIAVDADGVIIEGHGRVMAARKLGLVEVPVIVLGHMSESQKRAYILAHNKIALNAGWDEDMLKAELDALAAESFELTLAGWSEQELSEVLKAGNGSDSGKSDGLSDTYTQNIKAPIYTPKGDKPEVNTLCDPRKTNGLKQKIDASDIPEDIKRFLSVAADRHTVFHFARIAEFYCHATPEVQRLMEDSGLVVIDFKRAIENGFIALTKRLSTIADQEGESDEE